MSITPVNKKIILLIVFWISMGIFIGYQNNNLVETEINYQNEKIPNKFNNFKILQISDLHNKSFGYKQEKLIEHTQKINPDIIVITGDLIDKRRTTLKSMKDAISYVQQAIEIAPIYYVSGNHEAVSQVYEPLKTKLKNIGVTILENDLTPITIDDESITLMGLRDPAFYDKTLGKDNENDHAKEISRDLRKLKAKSKTDFNILLSHRPEKFTLYSKFNIDLVLTGHAHGGQARIPFLGPLIAPRQSLLPKYAEGIHYKKNTAMVISRGLGNSSVGLRIFNQPELVIINLKK